MQLLCNMMKILRSNHFEKAFTSYIIRSLSKNSQIHLSSEKFDFKYFEKSQSRDLSISVNCMRIIKLARKIVRKYSLLSLKTCSILIFRLSLHTVWKFWNFSAPHIFREINFGMSWDSKITILTDLKVLNFEFQLFRNWEPLKWS